MSRDATLGPDDFVSIIEAPDKETVAPLRRAGRAEIGQALDHAGHSVRPVYCKLAAAEKKSVG